MNHPGNVPTLGRGEVPTPEDIRMARKAKQINLAIQFMGPVLSNLPQNTYADGSNSYWSTTTVFEYATELAEHCINFMEIEAQTNLIQ